MDKPELTVKVNAGLIVKELEPGCPPEAGIYRYRYVTIGGKTKRSVAETKSKTEEAKADAVPRWDFKLVVGGW